MLISLLLALGAREAPEKGVDARFFQVVETALTEIDRDYVRPVDLADLADRGVEAIRAAAEVPEASFRECMAGMVVSPSALGRDAASARLARALQCSGRRRSQQQALITAAIRAIVKGLDPQSAYFDPVQYRALMRAPQEGHLGLLLTKRGDRFFVTGTRPGSPARAASIAPGDALAAINGAPPGAENDHDATLSGEIGSKVTLTLVDPSGTSRQVHLSRAGPEGGFPPDVEAERRGDTLVIHIYSLGRTVVEAVRAAVVEQTEPARAIVIDLRSNPGGLLDAAVSIADEFLARGDIAVLRRSRSRVERYPARTGQIGKGVPLVLLVNEFTASGAEIIAAALADHKRAVVVGRTTLGAGSVQTLSHLSSDQALKLTTSFMERPDGRLLKDAPVVPDCFVENVGEPEMAAALAMTRGDRSLGVPAPPAP